MLLVAWQLQVMGQSNGKMVHLSTQCSTHTQRRVCWQVLCRPQQCNGESWTIGLLDAMFGTDLEQSVHYYFTTEVKLSLQSFCSKLLKMVESTFSFTWRQMTRDSIFVGIQVCRNWEQETLSLSVSVSLFFSPYMVGSSLWQCKNVIFAWFWAWEAQKS